MSRTTIDFGIDLGTTNSAVAVLRGTDPNVIKNNDDHDITPSAVFIDKRGQSFVGVRAKARQEDENSVDDVYLEFKRSMGSDFKYEFKTAGRTMSPEQVSAEVLKSLRGDVQQRLSEDLQASVITVPAAFEAKQCAATKRAGELAGFAQCPLLQEPVAAALAYGFQSDVTKEFWLVYDFGGGTFDAAIMKAEEGSISVVNHGGDNYLGGSDIDWAILEKLIIPELTANHNFPGLSRGNRKWRHTLARIKNPVEAAKIQLSRSESAFIECKLKDADGEPVDFEYKLTRNALIDLAEPLIMRSIGICERVLKEKNLGPNAIEKVILVGGPTLSPYFRDILRTKLGIQLDLSVDPLTVVAKGAAVFAGTQRLEGKAAAKAAAGQFDVDLKYKPVGADLDPTVRGEVKSASGASVEGFSIEFSNQKTHWRSGKVSLKSEGRFKVNLLAEKREQNVFNIELWDSTGGKQAIVPNTLTYTVGLAISEQPIINSVAVELIGNVADVFFKKGDPLPAKSTKVYRSSATVKKGESGDILKVFVVEGEIELADRNRLLGSLEIIGKNLKRDVPVGSEIEVTLHFDASRILRAKAYIPMLDEEFEAVIDYSRSSPEPARLLQDLNAELKRESELRSKAEDEGDDAANELLDRAGDADEIRSKLEAGKGDPVAADQAEKRLLEFKIALDRAEDVLKWPTLVSEVNEELDAFDNAVDKHGNSSQRQKAKQLRQQADDLIEQKHPDALRKKLKQIRDAHYEILFEQPGFWVGFFNYLVEDRDKMKDSAAADRLIDQGRQFINRGNVDGLRNVVRQLLALLPRDIAEARKRGYTGGDPGLMK
jgi:molecular chaperone DnaK